MGVYRLSKYAERDLVEIASYVASRSNLETAERLLTDIVDSIIMVVANPNIGQKQDGLGAGIFAFPSRKYKIYYRKRRDGILVLHVFHGMRDQAKAFRG